MHQIHCATSPFSSPFFVQKWSLAMINGRGNAISSPCVQVDHHLLAFFPQKGTYNSLKSKILVAKPRGALLVEKRSKIELCMIIISQNPLNFHLLKLLANTHSFYFHALQNSQKVVSMRHLKTKVAIFSWWFCEIVFKGLEGRKSRKNRSQIWYLSCAIRR